MKLEGSLDAFSLPDIFQLLSFTKKSGGLHLHGQQSDGVVHFVDGAVTGATADSSRQALARRLVGSGAIADDALAAAVTAVQSAETPTGLGHALLDAAAIDAELLKEAATEQAVDAVFDLLQWTEGDFAFSLDETNPDDVGIALPTDRVVAEAEARKERWATITEVVPTPDVVLAMPVVIAEEPAVTRDDWALLALVDGQRTVRDLVDLTGCGQYAVVSTLATLVERGLLVVRDRRGDHVLAVERRHALLEPLEAAPPAPRRTTDDTGTGTTPAPEAPEPVATRTSTPTTSAASAGTTAQSEAVASSQVREPVAAPTSERQGTDQVAVASTASTPATGTAPQPRLGGAHVPGDVVPPRPEPFLPQRKPDHPGDAPAQAPHVRAVPAAPSAPAAAAPPTVSAVAAVAAAPTSSAAPTRSAAQPTGPSSRPTGPTAVPSPVPSSVAPTVGSAAIATDPQAASIIERDPSVNRSLLLRLIAGVRGL